MSDVRTASLRRVTAAAEDLGKLGDRTNEALKTLEHDLFEAGAAARATVLCADGDFVDWSVGWGKVRGEWQLIAVQLQGEPVSLFHAPLRVRLEALRRADEIIAVVAATMEEIVQRCGDGR